MSSEGRRDDRDLEDELASPAAGQVGIPVDAKCVGCGRIRVKRVRLEELDQEPTADPTTLEATDLTSFKHVCHPCGTATWWNPVAVSPDCSSARRPSSVSQVEGRWKWPDWGRGPYDALSSVMLGPPFEGYLELDVEIDGEPWHLKVSYSKSGFAPRLSDGINAERLYEWDIVGRGRGERKASYNVSPRFPNMRHWETGDPVNLPWENQVGEVDGVDVEFHTSNVEPERGLELLPGFFAAIFAEAGERIQSEYFRTTPHPASRMWAYERYVRIRREWAEKLSSAGVLQKVVHHLSGLEGVKAELHIDNKEVINHQNRLFLDPASVSKLLPGHTYGRKFEIYQLANPDAVSKDHPSYHPKVEVLVNKKRNDGEAWAWADRHDVTEQIEETLLNALHWEDIPLGPDGNGVYVPDDHFDAVAREQPVELYEDPTPRLEAKTDHLLMTTLRDMGDTARDITETVAT